MDQSNCQSCQNSFNSTQRIPKILLCDCIICAECIKVALDQDNQFGCKEHKQIFKGQISELRDYITTESFQKQLDKFQQEAQLTEKYQNFQQRLNDQKTLYDTYKNNTQVTQDFFLNIIKQVCEQSSRDATDHLQDSIRQSSQIVTELRNQIEGLEKISQLSSENRQQHEERIKLLDQIRQQYSLTNLMTQTYTQEKNEEFNVNLINEQLAEDCISAMIFIQEKVKTQISQSQDVAQLVNDYLYQKSQYDFLTLSSENISNFVQKFKKQAISGTNFRENPLNKSNICQDQNILDEFKNHQSQELIQKLNEVIDLSRNYKEVEQASANAITILKNLNYNFTQKNLEGIRIKGADLSDIILQDCNLRNANMQEVNLRSVKFINCNFSGANLTNCLLESPQYADTLKEHTFYVWSVAITKDQK